MYSVKALDSENIAPVSRIIEGIYWCIDNDINIINMSFGTVNYSNALRIAVEDAYESGILMIAAVGNESSTIEYPAAFSQVMGVAAVGTDAEIAEFSNMGDEVEIAAPGEKVKVNSFFGFQTVTHGTSIAAPHVTGAASLLWQKDTSKSNEFIRQLLAHSSKNIENTDECGLLDVSYALEIYDEFSIDTGNVPENMADPETFEEIDE